MTFDKIIGTGLMLFGICGIVAQIAYQAIHGGLVGVAIGAMVLGLVYYKNEDCK